MRMEEKSNRGLERLYGGRSHEYTWRETEEELLKSVQNPIVKQDCENRTEWK